MCVSYRSLFFVFFLWFVLIALCLFIAYRKSSNHNLEQIKVTSFLSLNTYSLVLFVGYLLNVFRFLRSFYVPISGNEEKINENAVKKNLTVNFYVTLTALK